MGPGLSTMACWWLGTWHWHWHLALYTWRYSTVLHGMWYYMMPFVDLHVNVNSWFFVS